MSGITTLPFGSNGSSNNLYRYKKITGTANIEGKNISTTILNMNKKCILACVVIKKESIEPSDGYCELKINFNIDSKNVKVFNIYGTDGIGYVFANFNTCLNGFVLKPNNFSNEEIKLISFDSYLDIDEGVISSTKYYGVPFSIYVSENFQIICSLNENNTLNKYPVPIKCEVYYYEEI